MRSSFRDVVKDLYYKKLMMAVFPYIIEDYDDETDHLNNLQYSKYRKTVFYSKITQFPLPVRIVVKEANMFCGIIYIQQKGALTT